MKNIVFDIMMTSLCVLALSSCQKNELSRQNAGKEKPVLTITSNRVSDNLLTFTIEADFNTAQFGYVILDGRDNPVPTAQSIVMDEVQSSLQSNVYSAVEQTKVRVDFECESDHDFQVFAAAITDTGLLSEVIVYDVYVPDTEIPSITKANVSGNVLTLTFTEDIFVNKESSATIQYVKWGVLEITDKEDLPLEFISTEGNRAVFNCPKPANGAGYLVSFPQGLFVDKSGNKAKGVESSLNLDTYTYYSLGWDDMPVDFAVEGSYFQNAPASSFRQDGATVSITFPFDVYKNENIDKPVSVVYNENSRKEYVYADYLVSADRRTVRVVLPRVPKATFDICFERGAIYDEWGNVNSAYEVTAENDYRYAACDLLSGDYRLTTDKADEFVIKFERSSAATVTMSADWFNLGRDVLGVDQTREDKSIMPQLVGIVNYESGTVSFDGSWNYRGILDTTNAFGSAFYYYGKDESRMIVFWGSGNGREPIIVHFNEDGRFTDIGDFDYSVHSSSNGGFISVYDSVSEGTPLTFTE
ncbi:MAG: hypothetical protein ACI3ZS_06125 [Candidatus Cryptobacteroides sp.]